jgi:CRISPR-associated endonuclease/helicase Cas3
MGAAAHDSDAGRSMLGFWGKARSTEGVGPAWHPVAYHCMDVAAVAQVLLQEGVSRPPPPWDEPGLHNSLAALVALHDVGKFTRPFQIKRQDCWPPVLGRADAPAGPSHDTTGFVLLKNPLAEGLNQLLGSWPSYDRVPILAALCGHHGRPPQDCDHLNRNVACSTCVATAKEFTRGVLATLPGPPLPHADGSPALGWWLAGLTVLADWIGSAECWFPYHAPDLSFAEYWSTVALPRAAVAVAAAGVLPAVVRPHLTLADIVGRDVPASPVQALAQTLDLAAAGPVLVLVEDQTGSGKTEAGLLLAHRLMGMGRAEGVFVALPTMATANAMYGRLAGAYRKLFEDGATPSLVLAHGRRADHAGFQDSILRDAAREGGGASEPGDEPSSAQCAAWIADDRRRTFLAGVGVGTIDQALLAVLPSRHAPLRLHGLHRRVLVVDEAHAYDSYMREELLRLVEFQAGLGGSTVVLSATLPQTTRRKLAAAYARGAGLRPSPRPVCEDYPLVTVLRRTGLQEVSCVGRPGLEREVEVERLPDMPAAIGRIVAAARAGQAVAWIRNAVDDVAEAHAALAAVGLNPTMFHARFAMGDRLDIEERVIDQFGPNSRDRSGVVVASQVIEQSLDIDFDLLVTDLAPMDLLIQRAGRLWRHHRPERPADRPRLLVLSPEPVDVPGADWLGPVLRRTGFVYGDPALLWRTARVLFGAGAIKAPSRVRQLVEEAYNGDVPIALQHKSNAASGKSSAGASRAKQNLLKWEAGYDINAGAWASDIRTLTRLGEEGTTLRLGRWDGARLEPWCQADSSARAWSLSEVQVGNWLATGVPAPEGALAQAVAQAQAGWSRWDREIPILALSRDGSGWHGSVLKGTAPRSVRYGSQTGLRFG